MGHHFWFQTNRVCIHGGEEVQVHARDGSQVAETLQRVWYGGRETLDWSASCSSCGGESQGSQTTCWRAAWGSKTGVHGTTPSRAHKDGCAQDNTDQSRKEGGTGSWHSTGRKKGGSPLRVDGEDHGQAPEVR